MSRADETTQVDYSLLDDRALGDAVAEKVLGASYIREGDYWELPGEAFSSEDLASWWGAGLVIDTLAAEGYMFDLEYDPRSDARFIGNDNTKAQFSHPETAVWANWTCSQPVRAVLVAALRAKEAE